MTHFLYKKLYIFTIIKSYIRNLYQNLGAFTTLQFNNIIVICIITLLSQVISIIFKNSKDGSFILKFLDGINYFIFLPYILIAPSLVRVNNRRGLFLIYFSLIILILGAVVNGRSFIFIGYANLLILYFFLSIYGKNSLKITKNNITKIISIITFLLIIIEPATKLAISMALARSIRDEATPIEILSETYYRYKSIDNVSEIIQTFEDLHFQEDTWDEHYVNNPFFGRLCNLKYADNIFVINQSLTTEDKELTKKQEIAKTFSILPQPIISLLNIPVNKEEATSGSMGDFLFFLTGGINEIEGSRTGSLIGTLFIVFDWAYPVFLGILTLGVYIIGDSYIIFKSSDKTPIFSPIAFLSFYPFLFFFTSSALGMESISGLLSFVLRGSIQTPIIYFILIRFSLFFLKTFKIR
ncbi:MAG: hypothetical protein LCH91_09140 [Bacteroidetes bacterium]|nr:hypothetical protein [Bacteroidota bacterium]